MAVKFTNNAKTTLASGITSSATSATVTDGSVFPSLSSGEHFYCTFDDGTNNEIVKVTARSGNTLTIVRAADNTTARAFSSGNQAELRATAALLTDIQENIAAKSANQTVYNTTTASSATSYNVGTDPGVEGNAMVFLNGVLQHHDTISFSGSTLTFDAAPPNGMALEVIIDNLINLQSSNLTVDTFTAADVSGSPQTDFTLSDTPAAEQNLIVFVDGVFQAQDAYTISNEVLTMTDGVTAGLDVTVYVINPVNIGTPSDSTVTSAKLSGNITTPGALTVSGAFTSQGIDDNADATAITISSDERVGVGTVNPTVLLDIYNSGGWGQIDLDGTTGGEIRFQKAGTNYGNIYANDSTGLVINAQNGLADIFLQSGGSTKMSILDSGNVGIGDTTSPTKQLEIRNNTATTGSGGAELRLTRGDSSGAEDDPIGIIDFYNTDADGAHVSSFIKAIAREQYARKGALTFGVASSTSTDATEVMRLNELAHVELNRGVGLYTDNLRAANLSITSSFSNALDFSYVGGLGAGRGFYLVTVVREGASVGTSIVLLVGLSTGSAVIIYDTISSNSLVAQTSGANLQIRSTGGSITCHATAVPIGITGLDS